MELSQVVFEGGLRDRGKAWSMRHGRGGQTWPTMKKPGFSAKYLGKPNCAAGAGWKWVKTVRLDGEEGRLVIKSKIPCFIVLPRALLVQWRRKWQPTPVFLPGKSHGQRSLVGYSPLCLKSWTWLNTAQLLVQVQSICLRMLPYAKRWLGRSLYPQMNKYQIRVLANSSTSHDFKVCVRRPIIPRQTKAPQLEEPSPRGLPTFTNLISRQTLFIKHWISSRN